MSLVLVNGFREQKSCDRLIVDETLMSPFGAIVIATQLVGLASVNVILFAIEKSTRVDTPTKLKTVNCMKHHQPDSNHREHAATLP
ncbi:hypothetical protein EVAR_16183_1 [Eumeta japonica]|uniref:Uncharacterized protein n=1 Tax=Eumeta variegata TaxID=151549 RepID=A0A4C1WEB0_EUMVA|nr:hypothetical protein EVAR_16183_1 [Eumeta japonica]